MSWALGRGDKENSLRTIKKLIGTQPFPEIQAAQYDKALEIAHEPRSASQVLATISFARP